MITRRRLLLVPAAVAVGVAIRPLNGLIRDAFDDSLAIGEAPPGETIVLDGLSDLELTGLAASIPEGGPKHALQVKNCRNVVIDGFQFFGGGIAVEDCDNISLRNGLVSRNVAGEPGWSDAEAGVRFLRSTNVDLINSVVAYADSLVRAEACENVLLEGCFTYNPRGPFPRGQHFQTWEFDGKRTQNITIRNHYSLTDFSDTDPFPPMQEDAMNFGQTDNVVIDNVLNEMRGAEQGSSSGSGLMFEGRSTGRVTRFTSIGQANAGFGVSSGSSVTMDDSLSVIPLSPKANIAGFVWEGGSITFGENVRMYGIKPDGSPYGSWWHADEATVIGLDGTIRGDSTTPEARAELEKVVRPAIPDVGFILPGATTDTSTTS